MLRLKNIGSKISNVFNMIHFKTLFDTSSILGWLKMNQGVSGRFPEYIFPNDISSNKIFLENLICQKLFPRMIVIQKLFSWKNNSLNCFPEKFCPQNILSKIFPPKSSFLKKYFFLPE